MLHPNKAVPTLSMMEKDIHLVCLYDLDEAKIVQAGAVESAEYTNVLQVIGIDCLVISDYLLSPLDTEIAKQIIRTYLGVVGLQNHTYFEEFTLRTALEA